MQSPGIFYKNIGTMYKHKDMQNIKLMLTFMFEQDNCPFGNNYSMLYCIEN